MGEQEVFVERGLTVTGLNGDGQREARQLRKRSPCRAVKGEGHQGWTKGL